MLATDRWLPFIRDGRVRALAVLTAERTPEAPAVPTLRELGWNVVVENMKGLNAPAGLPDEIYTSLHDRFRRGMQEPAWKTFLERTKAMDGYLDGPGYQAAMDAVLDALRRSVPPPA